MSNNLPMITHCFSCGKELQQNKTHPKPQKHPFPVCNNKTDIITLEKHLMCYECGNAFDSVKKFVQKYKVKAFSKDFTLDKVIDNSFVKMPSVDTLFTKQSKRKSQILQSTSISQPQQPSNQAQRLQINLNLPTDIYSAIIHDSIQSNNLHHVHWLPQTVKYMIYLTSIQRMRPEERRQRVKKTLQALSYLYCIDENQLKYLAILVQTLFCYMDQDPMLKILDRLLKGFLQNNISLEILLVEQTQEFIDKSFQETHLHKKPIQFRPDKILSIIVSIFVLLDFFKDSKLQKHILQLVSFCQQQLSIMSNGNNQAESLQKTFETYLKKNISDNASKTHKLSQTAFQELVQTKKQRNHLNFILKTMQKQNHENEELMKEMQNRFKKEKDEYINKIVKLNNHIEELQIELKITKENIQKMEKKSSRVLKMKDDDQQVKSNPQMKVSNAKDISNEPITERTQLPMSQSKCTEQSEIKKHKSQIQLTKELYPHQLQQETLSYLKSILQITDISSFNQKLSKKSKKSSSFPTQQLPHSLKQLSQMIITEINTLEKKASTLVQENKKLKEESTRLLSILKRKQESWLPLLQQKDEYISMYEKALILLQKGYILAQEPLSSRIQSIVQKVAKLQFVKLQPEGDDISMRSSLRDSIVQDISDLIDPIPNTPPEKQTSSEKKPKQKKQKTSGTKSGQKNSIKKKTKKQKQKQAQCQIY